MKKLSKRVLDEFFAQLDSLSITSTPREILSVILGWMRSNTEMFDQKPFSEYGLNYTLKLNEDIFPVDYSPLYGADFIHLRNCFKRCKHGYKDQSHLAMLLRDVLESLLCLEVELDCLACQQGGLYVWKNELDGNFIYECRQCGFLHYVDEYLKPFDHKLECSLVPATTLDLGYQTQLLPDTANVRHSAIVKALK